MLTLNGAKKTGWDISILDVATGKPRVFLETPFTELGAALTSDARWIAYSSNESGQVEVYVQSLGNDGGKWQISTAGGGRPRWSRNDSELVFQSPDDKLMVVDVKLVPTFAASVPRLFFDPRLRAINGYQFAFAPDGKRLLINRAIEQPVVTPVTLVQNWTQGLGK